MRKPPPAPGLVKMAELARLSGVPAPTIKHYLREGLLPTAPVRTSPNMAYYDVALVPRIKAIKELQRTRFLPLRVIRDLLDGAVPSPDERKTTAAIAQVLRSAEPADTATRAELLARGVPAEELDWLERARLVTPLGSGEGRRYGGDDLALIRTLREARLAGLTYEMLPFSIVESYRRAILRLVRLELSLFQGGVARLAGSEAPRLAEAAARLSERLVVLIRRKLILPTLQELELEAAARRPGRGRRPRR